MLIPSPSWRIDSNYLLKRVQKTKALKQFFVKFVEFAELAERRTTLFKQLQQKYPGRVSIPHGESSAFLYFKPDPEYVPLCAFISSN